MKDISSDDILQLKQRLTEQEVLEKQVGRKREIDHLQAQLDKLRRMNFGSRSEKVSRRIAQMEADLNRLQKESDALTGQVDDPAVQRPLRQTRPRKPFPESLPRGEKRLLPAEPCCPDCDGTLSYLGEDAAEQMVLMRSAFRGSRSANKKNIRKERAPESVVLKQPAFEKTASVFGYNEILTELSSNTRRHRDAF
ncbi:hypothetical protein SB6422_05789 [Klebsiella huaxiensis]|uniref:Transposase TnpC homeodomain domain-containing protein n=1 Tax=Klebsiella huaxiensis TaxID=2153354 RepID=A0A564KTD3_9ENTR|nr:hypothetical protein SB6422_05789 [Klebsiella huaxiensis]